MLSCGQSRAREFPAVDRHWGPILSQWGRDLLGVSPPREVAAATPSDCSGDVCGKLSISVSATLQRLSEQNPAVGGRRAASGRNAFAIVEGQCVVTIVEPQSMTSYTLTDFYH